MRVFISVDMEGVTGVTCWDDVDDSKPSYQRFREVMTGEVNAAVEGALAGGATSVLINDSHAGMRNVLLEKVHPKAELISGWSNKPLGMMSGVNSGIDVAFLIGYHAKAGTPHAILDHTWSSARVYALFLNGQEIGETGLSAALAGHFGVPVAMVSGDQALAAEASALLGPNLRAVTVKQAINRQAARSLPVEEAYARIRVAAEEAVTGPLPEPYQVETPVTVGIQFVTSLQAAGPAYALDGARLVNGRLVEWTVADIPAAYRGILTMLALS